MRKKQQQPKKMASVLAASTGTLSQINIKANFLSKLSDIVRQLCPDLPADSWQISNFRQNTAVIEVKNAIWAQRLQFERYKITEQLKEISDGDITQIVIKVIPPHITRASLPEPENKQKSTIPTASREHLLALAENAPKGLKEKLIKLAESGQKNGQ